MSDELLTPYYWSINKLFEYRFSVPVYQRPYSWQTNEVDSLLFDIWDSYTENKKLSEEDRQRASLYVGNIILHKKAFEHYDIIDGQQRITTFSILLLALYSRAFELDVDSNNRILIKMQKALWKLNMSEKPVQDKRVIELGSIDKQVLIDVFNEAFSQPKTLKKYVNSYNSKSPFEKNVITNFNRAYDFLKDKFSISANETENLLLFANYMLTKVYIIAIINEDSEFKAFSIFESINSKGKKLEEIDLIKTRIFSKLRQEDYSSYLNKWGKLIIDTKDKLYDFFKIYIKANIKYYTGNVTYQNFVNLDKELCGLFNKSTIEDAYKALIEDMVDKIDCFNAVFKLPDALGFINNNKFRFYYCVYLKINYEHPWPLFFKCFCEYKKGALTKEDLMSIIIETIKFCIIFLTIYGKDSKDVIPVFSSIFEKVYQNKKISKDWVIYQLNSKLTTLGPNRNDGIVSQLKNTDLFSKNKQLGAAILSVYESQYENGNEKHISWDEAYSKYSTYGSAYTLDHIMVQTPDLNDSNLKYYKLGNVLKLKNGHDFPYDLVHEGMDYEEFKSLILHKVGNLRLKGGDGNSSRSNSSDETFNTYSQLETRNKIICEFFVSNVIDVVPTSKSFNIDSQTNVLNRKMTGNFDFSMTNLDFTGTKPKTITFSGETYQISSLKDILKKVVIYLFNKDKDKLILMAKTEWKPRQRVVLTYDKEKLINAFEIIDGIYIETNLNAKDIVFYSSKLLEEYNVDKSTVSVYIPE